MSTPSPTTATVAEICDMYPATSTKRSLLRAFQEGGWMICKYGDPVDGPCKDLLLDEAVAVIDSDPALVYLQRFAA